MDRRTFVSGLLAAGSIGITGCLGAGDDEPTREERARVTVVNRLGGELTVDIGILEPGQSFEEGIRWRVTFGVGEDSVEVVEDGVTGSEYRVVLRAEGYDDYERVWSLAECAELSLTVEVREDGFREAVRSCRRPQ
jgi:hypothetical protein